MVNLRLLNLFSRDLLAVGALGILSLGAAALANSIRERPLPIVYIPKLERLNRALAGVDAGQAELAPSSNDIRMLLPFELRQMMTNGAVIVIDARPEVFHQRGHIAGALPLPREEFAPFYQKHQPLLERDKNQQVVIYCQGGDCEDSEMLARALLRLGYTKVGVLAGGWEAWQEATGTEEGR